MSILIRRATKSFLADIDNHAADLDRFLEARLIEGQLPLIACLIALRSLLRKNKNLSSKPVALHRRQFILAAFIAFHSCTGRVIAISDQTDQKVPAQEATGAASKSGTDGAEAEVEAPVRGASNPVARLPQSYDRNFKDVCVGLPARKIRNLTCYVYVCQDRWTIRACVRMVNIHSSLARHFYAGFPLYGFKLNYLNGPNDPQNDKTMLFEFGSGRMPEEDTLVPGSNPTVGVALFTPRAEAEYLKELSAIPAAAKEIYGFALSKPGEYRLTVVTVRKGAQKSFATLDFHYENEQISESKSANQRK